MNGPGHRPRAGAARVTVAAIALFIAWSVPGLLLSTITVSASGPTVVIDYPFGFGPASVKIRVGQTVTWVNKEPIAHGVVPLNGGFRGDSTIAAGKSFTAKFSKKGTFTYRDSYNQLWTGKVIVVSSITTPTAKATPKPTPRATPKPTVKATPKPTPKATPATVAIASEPPGASPPPAAAGAVTGGSGGSGGSTEPGSTTPIDPSESGFGLGAILAMIGLVALAFVGGALFTSRRRPLAEAPLVAGVGTVGSTPPIDPIVAASASNAATVGVSDRATPPLPADTRYQMPHDVVEDEPLQNSRTEPSGGDDA